MVQRASVEVLHALYEADFKGFSYGFRPGKSAHHALDAVRFMREVSPRLQGFGWRPAPRTSTFTRETWSQPASALVTARCPELCAR